MDAKNCAVLRVQLSLAARAGLQRDAPEDLLAKCDPIRRQLLGDGVDVKGWWQPTEADVPLKGWLREHRGEDYLKALG